MSSYPDVTNEILNNIVERRKHSLYHSVTRQHAKWIYRQYMLYMISAVGSGYQVPAGKFSHFKLYYITYRDKRTRRFYRAGIRSRCFSYFTFFLRYVFTYKKESSYYYKPTRWMVRKLRERIDSDFNLQIVPQ